MNGLDWPVLMRAGLVGLRLPPDQFWRLTPVELRLMLGHGGGLPAMNKAGLDALLVAYPDKTQGERDDGS
ncbi:rcc01693 family protein [uncultured Ruegeria sp.]|uniref:rcc01693 family protein n=1 Tax=uncultured Ruegeria sp. TaxID=259304 RepID=UPI0026202CC9|nr:rcc01693 family protein [uncultured Ruegeria sp.]